MSVTLSYDTKQVRADETIAVVQGTGDIVFASTDNVTTAASATAGSATLPDAPVGFIEVLVGGDVVKVPYYGV